MGQLAAHLDRGWDLVARGDFAGAMLSAEKSLELDEASPEGHNLVGYIYQAEGRPEEALEHYRMALDLDEGFIDAMLNAADVMVHPLRDLDGALAMVRHALEWLHEDEVDVRADALLLEVDIHLLRQDTEAALKTVRELPTGPFDNPTLALSVGRARLDVGDLEGAEPLIRRATELSPPTADAFYFLALCLEARKDRAGSLVAALQARELDVQSPPPPWAIPTPHFERRVQRALAQLPEEISGVLAGALVVVTDLPGAEVVAEGLDPRMPVLLDAIAEVGHPPSVGRVFIYKRNIERLAPGLMELDAEVLRALITEVCATFEIELPVGEIPEESGDDDDEG